MRRLPILTVLLAFLALTAGASPAHAAKCSDYPNQAAAQAAGDTVDADGDGILCEGLPCPCSTAKPGTQGEDNPGSGDTQTDSGSQGSGSGGKDGKNPKGCVKPKGVQDIGFSATKYPNIRQHALDAIKAGWPSILVLNRKGASQRRERLLRSWETRDGYDRDEYPPAVGRGKGAGLMRGLNPIGWKADVQYVPSAENRSHGSVMGVKLRRFCNGTRFRYVFY